MNRSLMQELRRRGVDVVTAQELGKRHLPDIAQLTFATELGRVICSKNVRDFVRLHAEYLASGYDHAGIVVVGYHLQSVGEQLRRLMSLLEARSSAQMENMLEFLSNW